MDKNNEVGDIAGGSLQSEQKKNYVAPTGPQVLSLRDTEKTGPGADGYGSTS